MLKESKALLLIVKFVAALWRFGHLSKAVKSAGLN